MSAVDPAAWVGRSETAHDTASANRVAGLAALLDDLAPTPAAHGILPPLAHWLHFQPAVSQSRIGPDGHARGDAASLLPPIDLPRRMWAGGRVRFLAAVPIGAPLMRRSTVTAVTPKSGKSGLMVFVTVAHEILYDGAIAIHEEQDLVFRGTAGPGLPVQAAPPTTPAADGAGRLIVPDPVLLFRYSALTFNGHRIHYDRDYARDVEGYPGLVVHGPLVATLLLHHALGQTPGATAANFTFRAQSPLFDTAPFDLHAVGGRLEARAHDGRIAMQAELTLS